MSVAVFTTICPLVSFAGQKTIHELLKEYGEVDILEGQLCRNDERKLRHLDRSFTDFRVKCMKTLAELGKRCSSNNPHSQSNVKKPRPLFRDADEDDIIVSAVLCNENDYMRSICLDHDVIVYWICQEFDSLTITYFFITT